MDEEDIPSLPFKSVNSTFIINRKTKESLGEPREWQKKESRITEATLGFFFIVSIY